jgi:hypothetical protein
MQKFDILKRFYDLIFLGYSAEDRKIKICCMDMFMTAFMSIDPATYFKKKIETNSPILQQSTIDQIDHYRQKHIDYLSIKQD